MKTIGYAANEWGYVVQVCEDGKIIEEYSAGNHQQVSDVWVQPGSIHADSPANILDYAERTALEVAKEHGVKAVEATYDADLEEAIREFQDV